MTRTMKTLTSIAAAAIIAVAAIAAPQPAEARGNGGAVAAGIIGGLALGAIIAGSSRPAYSSGYYAYGPGPAYYGPRCYTQRERFWDGWGWRTRRVRVCD